MVKALALIVCCLKVWVACKEGKAPRCKRGRKPLRCDWVCSPRDHDVMGGAVHSSSHSVAFTTYYWFGVAMTCFIGGEAIRSEGMQSEVGGEWVVVVVVVVLVGLTPLTSAPGHGMTKWREVM